ncbi:MAG: vitamin K epoxide reductase family protein [bacterium]|nr:vitamin K epoxide reductase family protein [bacterium]
MRNKTLVLAISILSVVGLADSAFLTREHFAHTTLNCTVTKGCEKVLSSSYATIFNIPVALFGVIFYFFMLILTVHFLFNTINKKLLLLVASLGVISSVYLLSIQAFVLKAWCQYCLLADLTALVIFTLSVIIYLNKEKINVRKT